ncbi:MAG: ACP phosphodiesterase [Pseudomonadota bacterium]
MNYLAHLVLAGSEADHRLGALLGDHIKGQLALQSLRPSLVEGVRLHRKIDAWSDRHAAVQDFIQGLSAPWRRYAGIILDVLFDHLLSEQWLHYGPIDQSAFADQTEQLLRQHRADFPLRLQRFTQWAEQVSLWRRMHEREMIQQILTLIGRRHGRPSPLAEGLELLDQHRPEIEQMFARLMPDLMNQSQAYLAALPSAAGPASSDGSFQ